MAESSREEIAKLEALYASNPEGRVFTHLAEAYRKAGELERARGILSEGLAKHPGYASAHVVLGRVLMDLQEGSEAADAFRHVLELDPHNLIALQSLAELSKAAGRVDEALRYYQELRAHDPNSVEVEEAIAELSGSSARTTEAEEWTPAEFEEAAPGQAIETTSEPGWEPALPSETEMPAESPSEIGVGAEAWGSSEETEPQEPWADQQQSRAAEDIDLDWLAADEQGDLDRLTGHDDEKSRTFDYAGEIGDINSLSAAKSQAGPQPVPFEDFTLEPAIAGFSDTAEEHPGELLTETIAELYRSQGLYDRAADVYRSLLRERPGESALEDKLREVEGLGRGETPRLEVLADAPWDTFSVEEIESAELARALENEPEIAAEEAEAWLAGGGGTTEGAPTPYAWAEQASDAANESGPAISAYFATLLGWRPRSATSAPGSGFGAISETAEAETAPTAEESFPVLEERGDETAPDTPPISASMQEPASEAPAAMPWERAIPDSVPPPPAARAAAGEAAIQAFDEWFGPPESPDPESPQAQPTGEAAPGEGDDDDDLEMFRSWLQSLKK